MKVTILLGSVREGRQTHRAAYYVEQQLKKKGVEADLIDLAEVPLPVMGHKAGYEPGAEQKIAQISNRLEESLGVILVTPEYHGSFSGALKNALDHFTPEFQKKPVGVVAASAGGMAGINASTQLQHVILSLNAFPVPLKLLIPKIHDAFDDEFQPRDNKVENTTKNFLDEFLWFVDALYQKKTEGQEQEYEGEVA